MAGVIPALHPATIAPQPNLRAYLDVTSAAGFTLADFNMADALALEDAEGLDAVVEAFGSRGVQAGGWGSGVRIFADDAAFDGGLRNLPRAAALASALGARAAAVVVPNRSEQAPERALVHFAGRIAQLADALAPHEVEVSLEFIGARVWPELPHRLPDDIGGMLELDDRAGRSNVGVLFDTYHFHCGSSRLADIGAAAGRINLVHLNDAPPGDPSNLDDSVRRLPGDGVMDLGAVIEALEAAGYSGSGGVEVFSDELLALPALDAARRVAAATRAVLGLP
jgi:sugar phosphate isomerase/epimerase